MTVDRLKTRPRIEVEQLEHLVIKPGEEFFPFADITVNLPNQSALERASRDFTIEDERYGLLTGRFFFKHPFSGGNASIEIVFLPIRYYTLARQQDDLIKIDSGTYPGKPTERLEFGFGIDLLGSVGENRAVNFASDFDKTAQIQVTNHITGKTFNATRQRAWVGYDDTRCPYENQFTLIFDEFYYEGQEPVLEHQRDAGVEMFAQQELEEIRQGKEPTVEEIQRRHDSADTINNQRSFREPFHLAFVKVPKVMEQIGITLTHKTQSTKSA